MNAALSDQRRRPVFAPSETRTEGLAWWLWPHVLSLDAPIVAVIWQHWWAHATGARLPWFDDVILGLGVWMIYLADRLADTWRGGGERPETARHAFFARHHRGLRLLLAGVGAGLALLTPAVLPAWQFLSGLGLLAVAGGYFWLIHRQRPARWARFIPKEAFVGAIFASGTAFFPAGQTGAPRGALLAAAGLFAVLCFFNCALITQWEASARDQGEPTSLLNAFPGLRGRLGLGCLWLGVVAGLFTAGSGSTVFVPLGLGALMLAGLDCQRRAWSPHALRVLADVALFVPLLCGGWPRW